MGTLEKSTRGQIEREARFTRRREAARVVARARAEGEHWASDYPSAADVKGAAAFVTLCETVGAPQPFGAYEIRLRSDGAAIGGAGFNSSLDAAGVVPIGFGLVPSAEDLATRPRPCGLS